MNETATETRSVVVEREIPFPPEKLWRALTQPHLIEAWLMKNDFSPVVGHRFNLRGDFTSAAASLTTRSFEDLPDEAEYSSFSYGDVTFRSTDGEPSDLKVYSNLTLPLPQVQSQTLFSNRNFNPLVVEFPHHDDPMAARLLARKRAGLFDHYRRERWEIALGGRFDVVESETLPSGTRTLYGCTLR